MDEEDPKIATKRDFGFVFPLGDVAWSVFLKFSIRDETKKMKTKFQNRFNFLLGSTWYISKPVAVDCRMIFIRFFNWNDLLAPVDVIVGAQAVTNILCQVLNWRGNCRISLKISSITHRQRALTSAVDFKMNCLWRLWSFNWISMTIIGMNVSSWDGLLWINELFPVHSSLLY